MTSLDELVTAFRGLDIEPSRPVIAHASLSAMGTVQGGAEAVIDALLSVFHTLVMPTFTYKTMLVPETGPEDNGLAYGRRKDANKMAEFFHPEMPADRLMGVIPEALRRRPQAHRSTHPILSFAGVNTNGILDRQSLADCLAPIGMLVEAEGWVLLIGVGQTVNTSIHFVERIAGRKQFIRWALTPDGVVECPGFPGCSDGFNAIAPLLAPISRRAPLGQTFIQAMSLVESIEITKAQIQADPLAFLCENAQCERCETVRKLAAKIATNGEYIHRKSLISLKEEASHDYLNQFSDL
jgi:aminoglycoside 3-N-acetyltransferase